MFNEKMAANIYLIIAVSMAPLIHSASSQNIDLRCPGK
jgi:hypothetical protein